MEISHLLLEAANLLVLGMVSVFLFLGLMVFAVQLMSKFAPPIEQPPATKSQAATSTTTINNPKLVAAITSAVQQYRSANK